MRVSTGKAAVRAARVVKRGGVDPVDALRVALRTSLFGGEDVPDWRVDAACAEVPADLFFAESSASHNYREARLVCGGCPVRSQCLDDALSWELPGQRHGLLGGLSPVERDQLVRGRRGGAA